MFVRVSPLIPRLAVLSLVLAFGAATVGADLLESVTCGVEEAADCGTAPGPGGDDEEACDHCPSCLVSHGHMQSLVADMSMHAPAPRTSGLASLPRHLRPRIAVQDIFHPPITPSV